MVDPFKNERGVLDCLVNKILLVQFRFIAFDVFNEGPRGQECGSKLNRILPFFGHGISAFAVERDGRFTCNQTAIAYIYAG
jgi:hypothetical protein